jgi:flagellar hook-associated protein 3 FlgL
MVSRVTTPGNYASVLANLLKAQQNQQLAGEKVATQQNGSNLKDFAKNSEVLGAMRSVQSRLQVYSDQNNILADRLATQDQALNSVYDAAARVRQLMQESLASGRVDNLVQDIQGEMNNAVAALNARYAGKYMFAGGQVDTAPFSAQTLSDLTAPPASISALFQNDNFKAVNKVDEATTVTTGILASDIGTEMMTALQAFQQFNAGANGPFDGAMTDAQKAFLESQLQPWGTVASNVVIQVARNGSQQKRLENVEKDITGRTNALAGMIGEITDADMALAASQLQTAQLSVQSAAYVFQALKDSSLINILR